MGRSASHITLECALQTHPNIALIGGTFLLSFSLSMCDPCASLNLSLMCGGRGSGSEEADAGTDHERDSRHYRAARGGRQKLWRRTLLFPLPLRPLSTAYSF